MHAPVGRRAAPSLFPSRDPVSPRGGPTLAATAGNDLVALEGGFGTRLLRNDVCEIPVMFGPNGYLQIGSYSNPAAPGLGIDVRASRLDRLTCMGAQIRT